MKIYLLLILLFLISSVCLAEKTSTCDGQTKGTTLTFVCKTGCRSVPVTCTGQCCSNSGMAQGACGSYGGVATWGDNCGGLGGIVAPKPAAQGQFKAAPAAPHPFVK
jgi:hypothetical protein